ncbi:MAG: TrkA family potassium uptake protein [Dehalococcoidia bacterium]|nr:TrkA family potassium uptake protein [Dehalococcoidia bacterium]
MKAIIMGCGRVGAQIASMLDSEGHDVTVIDIDPGSFRRLPPTFQGRAMVGNGIDQDVLKRAGIHGIDAFAAVTQGDNRNVMAAQIAKHIFNVPKVVCRIYDPIREEVYHSLGLETVSPTTLGARVIKEALES